jgi:hypothetical protein
MTRIFSLKNSIKRDLLKHYKKVKTHMKHGLEYKQAWKWNYYSEEREYDLQLSSAYFGIIDDLIQKNFNEINEIEYFLNNFDDHIIEKTFEDSERIKTLCLKHFCTFNHDIEHKKTVVFGIFIISNWYLNSNQLNYFE